MPPVVDPAPTPKGVALTLSGGGFRATLFHLGVVRQLSASGILPHVTHITSVSGGSILAAHLVLNWEQYAAGGEAFEKAAADLVRFARWDLRGRVVRPWLVNWGYLAVPRFLMRRRWWRTALLQTGYDRLYRVGDEKRPATLKDLARPGRPELHILATSMTTGQMASFGGRRFTIETDPSTDASGGGEVSVPADDVPVSLAVTASSAFPPLFPPVRVDAATFKPETKPAAPGADEKPFEQAHYLADGGVFDNLGIRKMVWVAEEQKREFDLVVVSDAQRVFAKNFKAEYSLLVSRAGRSVDLLMDRVSYFENEAVRELCPGDRRNRLVECRLQNPVPPDRPDALPEEAQKAVQNVRTDLDIFSGVEINALVRQGAAVARLSAERCPLAPGAAGDTPPPAWEPVPGADPRTIDGRAPGPFHVARGVYRSLFNWRDWSSWALVVLAVGVLVGAASAVYFPRKWRHEAEAAAAQAATELKAATDRQEEEKRAAARAAEHVETKLRIVRALGRLATARPENWDDAQAEWDRLWGELGQRGDGDWFVWFFTDYYPDGAGQSYQDRIAAARAGKAAAIKAGGKSDDVAEPFGAGGAALFGLTLEVAKQLRTFIGESGAGESGYLKALLPRRKQMYDEAVRLADRFAKESDKPWSELHWTRTQFWVLYWGEMAVVEGPKVAGAMVAIKEQLKLWKAYPDRAPPAGVREALANAAKTLKAACDKELVAAP